MSVNPFSKTSKTSTVIQFPPIQNSEFPKDNSVRVQQAARRGLSCSVESGKTRREKIVGRKTHKTPWRASSVPPSIPELPVTIKRNQENLEIDIQIKSFGTTSEIIQYCKENYEKLDGINASIAIELVAKFGERLRQPEHLVLCLLTAVVSTHLYNLGPEEISRTARGLARLNFNDGELFEDLAKITLQKIEDFTPENITGIAWAFAKRADSNKELFQALAWNSMPKLPEFTPQQITEIASAFARFGYGPKPFFKGLAERALALIEEFNPHQISNIAAAFAGARYRHKIFLKALALRTASKINDFNLAQICETAQAFATLGYRGADLREPLAREALLKLPAMGAEDIANIVWSLVRMETTDAALFDAIAREALPKLTKIDAWSIANLARAFSKIRSTDKSLFLGIAMAALPKLNEFSSDDWTLMVSICAQLGEALANETKLKVPHMTPQEIANTACAFVTIGVKDEQLFQTIAKETITKIRKFTPLDIASIAKAFAMVDLLEKKFLEEMLTVLPRYPRLDELIKLKYVWQHFKQKHEADPFKWPQELLDSFAEFDIVQKD